MHIDDFAPNLSFFFSNGMDPEYTVMGRVARRIWAVAMKEKYGANERSQKLKYHIQTSGRSLHAQEIQFNDIRNVFEVLMVAVRVCSLGQIRTRCSRSVGSTGGTCRARRGSH